MQKLRKGIDMGINYKKLLIHYLDVVMCCEGTDFLNGNHKDTSALLEEKRKQEFLAIDKLTPEEEEALEACSLEATAEAIVREERKNAKTNENN
jgi:hypothetical protein